MCWVQITRLCSHISCAGEYICIQIAFLVNLTFGEINTVDVENMYAFSVNIKWVVVYVIYMWMCVIVMFDYWKPNASLNSEQIWIHWNISNVHIWWFSTDDWKRVLSPVKFSVQIYICFVINIYFAIANRDTRCLSTQFRITCASLDMSMLYFVRHKHKL